MFQHVICYPAYHCIFLVWSDSIAHFVSLVACLQLRVLLKHHYLSFAEWLFMHNFLFYFQWNYYLAYFVGKKARVIFMIVLKVCFHFAWWLFLSFYTLFWFNTLSSLHNILPSLARFSDSVVFDPFNICRNIYFALFCRDEFLLFVFIYCSVCLTLWNQMPFINVSHLTFFISSCAQ